jgi:hypothetical protein
MLSSLAWYWQIPVGLGLSLPVAALSGWALVRLVQGMFFVPLAVLAPGSKKATHC